LGGGWFRQRRGACGNERVLEGARSGRVAYDGGEYQRDPAGRTDRVVGGGVARDGRPVDEGVLVGVLVRPVAHGVAGGSPSACEVAALAGGVGGLGGRADGVAGVDDERGPELVAAREVPV